MKRRAFTLIELAISLTIIGIIIGGSFQAVKAMREKSKITEAKEQIKAAKDAVKGYAIKWPNLPSGNEFDQNLSPVQNNQHAIFYAADTNLSTINNDVCAYGATDLSVVDNGVAPARVINDVAFVLVHEGANYNMQTALDTSVTPNEVNIYGAANQVDDNATPVNIVDFYDDIVEWVTLDELQQNVGCSNKPFRFLNDRLPSGKVGDSYASALYVENNVSVVNINCTASPDYNITFTNPSFSGTPTPSGTALFDCSASEISPGSRTISKKFVITIDP